MELTDRLLKLMEPKDRKLLGKAGRTSDEIQAENEAKSEKELHEQFYAFLSRNGFGPTLIIHAAMYKKSQLPIGWPDFSILHKGSIMFLEFKVAKNTTSPAQDIMIRALRDSGFTVFVLYTLEAAQRETKTFFNL